MPEEHLKLDHDSRLLASSFPIHYPAILTFDALQPMQMSTLGEII
jgi:hypothetical protein